MAKLFAPDGTPIVSTYEKVFGTCSFAQDSVIQNADGTFDFDYEGGTDVDWDSQVTVTRKGQRIFVDEGGDEWPENVLVLREEEPDDEED